MKKLLVFLMLLCLVTPASASAPLVVDNADILSVQEEYKLSQLLDSIQKRLGIDVVVLTEDFLYGADPMDYADDYYDRNGYGSNGVLLLLDMGGRNWWISTAGSCIAPVDADVMEEHVVPYLSDGKYFEGFTVYAKLVEAAMERQGEKGEYLVDAYGNVSFQPYVAHWYDGLAVCLIIGVVIGGISVAVMAFGMKSVRAKGSAADYVERGSLQLTCQEDRYLYQTVTRRAKPKDSGTHTGSSGRSHGGGGGRF